MAVVAHRVTGAIAFLSVKGVFLLALQCDDPSEAGRQWAELAMEICKQALRAWVPVARLVPATAACGPREVSRLTFTYPANVQLL
jgi:hypothetical protein